MDSTLSRSGSRIKKLCDSQLVSPDVISKAFCTAVRSNQPQNVAILANCLLVETYVPRHFKDSALVFAAKHGQLQAVETLNKNEQGEWSLSVLQEALEVARNNPVRNYIRTITCNQLFNRRASGRLEAVMKCLAGWNEESKSK
ncbi:hypothetical protein PHYSODRAFT_301182 [Phytophthora sojae]|uniref:Uncharacterized protein n=1 Tax=Phytophthora sojae (strain P6497) TaxID=1094619 RepID=G4ZGE2_PHYSP|nr:hypothetical protein PHYSODRAFT_301182 [Phytophthora sojae]EGZ18587.1 hypothetical protein PHYSODRAFT_301182 [Phytophthora sojae]|eukprot:XP_009527645.1 hypothetical protein PHYSODRAFT_301182 [Phytophthora sojae]